MATSTGPVAMRLWARAAESARQTPNVAAKAVTMAA
jgi:hypothetical protein